MSKRTKLPGPPGCTQLFLDILGEATLGKWLLVSAGIGPNDPGESEQGDQYAIEGVWASVDGFVVRNRGIDHHLEVRRAANADLPRPKVEIEVYGGQAHYTVTGDVEVTLLNRDDPTYQEGEQVRYSIDQGKHTGTAKVLEAEIDEDDYCWRYRLDVLPPAADEHRDNDGSLWVNEFELEAIPGIPT